MKVMSSREAVTEISNVVGKGTESRTEKQVQWLPPIVCRAELQTGRSNPLQYWTEATLG